MIWQFLSPKTNLNSSEIEHEKGLSVIGLGDIKQRVKIVHFASFAFLNVFVSKVFL